jgi:hypothetical protein
MEITAQDFEHLFETAMEWNATTWQDQILRFDFKVDVPKGHIYWVENYSDMMLCRQFLNDRNFFCVESFDEAMEQWCFISDYDFHSARVSA